MALITITPTTLAFGTESADLPASGTSVIAGNTFEVDVKFNPNILFILEEVGGGACTITFDAGDVPPAARGGLGADTVVLAASDLFAFIPEPGRHMQNDGKITGSVATNNARIRALRLPPGISGGV